MEIGKEGKANFEMMRHYRLVRNLLQAHHFFNEFIYVFSRDSFEFIPSFECFIRDLFFINILGFKVEF